MRRAFCLLSVAIVWVAFAAAAAHADKRVALVIGNSSYESVPDLRNPIRDATAIAAALARLGFTVRTQSDLGFDAMRRALKDFAGASSGADVAIIYYAGHGMEIGGENYLIPVDARLATDIEVLYEALPMSLALGALEGSRGTRVLILDACRNNPFIATMRVGAKSRAIGRGLARVEPDFGTLVAYAAKEGTTADDGDSEHSPFTKALLQHIEEPGIDVQFLFRKVRDTVLAATNGNQEPFTYGSLPGNTVVLAPAKEAAPAEAPRKIGPGVEEIAAEVAFWNTIKDSGDRALIESYLKQYPNGRFASLAGIFIARLDAQAGKSGASRPLSPADLAPKAQAAVPESGAAVSPGSETLAALPAEAPVAAEKPSRELIRSVQNELLRVGCEAGKADGVWGKKSRSAVDAFASHAKIALASLEPSQDLLSALQGQSGRVCPLVCGARYEVSGDSCVLKTCPSGMKLDSGGDCHAPPPQVKQATPTSPPAKKKAKAATGGCRKETEQQCIGRMTSLGSQKTGLDFDQLATHCARASSRIQICR